MKEERLLGGEVGGEQEEEEDNVGEVGEARWGMSFLSLHLSVQPCPCAPAPLEKPKTIRRSACSCQLENSPSFSGSSDILLSSQPWPLLLLSICPVAEIQKAVNLSGLHSSYIGAAKNNRNGNDVEY